MSDPGSNTVQAAGAVLWREKRAADEAAPSNGEVVDEGEGVPIEVALVHRPRYDDWSLPKGKLESGETVPHCAVREVAEETGFTAQLSRRLGTVEYPALRPPGWRKSVVYFSARARSGSFSPGEEVDELRWSSVEQACELASHDSDRHVLHRFAALPAVLRTVLLVRHAKAGNRTEWHDDDALRPLSAAGKRQAEALRTMLPLFGPERIFSAPPLRCLQTVELVATDLGLPIRKEPRLSEEDYWPDPEAGFARFLQMVNLPGTPLLCSQGGVIPDLIEQLATRDRLNLGRIASKKGSVWALFLLRQQRDLRLVAADYYPSPLPVPIPETPSEIIG